MPTAVVVWMLAVGLALFACALHLYERDRSFSGHVAFIVVIATVAFCLIG